MCTYKRRAFEKKNGSTARTHTAKHTHTHDNGIYSCRTVRPVSSTGRARKLTNKCGHHMARNGVDTCIHTLQQAARGQQAIHTAPSTTPATGPALPCPARLTARARRVPGAAAWGRVRGRPCVLPGYVSRRSASTTGGPPPGPRGSRPPSPTRQKASARAARV